MTSRRCRAAAAWATWAGWGSDPTVSFRATRKRPASAGLFHACCFRVGLRRFWRRHVLHLHDRSAPARIISPPRQFALLSGLLLPDGGMAGGKQSFVRLLHGRRSEEHTSELQSLMRISYAVFCLKKKNHNNKHNTLDPTPTSTS